MIAEVLAITPCFEQLIIHTACCNILRQLLVLHGIHSFCAAFQEMGNFVLGVKSVQDPGRSCAPSYCTVKCSQHQPASLCGCPAVLPHLLLLCCSCAFRKWLPVSVFTLLLCHRTSLSTAVTSLGTNFLPSTLPWTSVCVHTCTQCLRNAWLEDGQIKDTFRYCTFM